MDSECAVSTNDPSHWQYSSYATLWVHLTSAHLHVSLFSLSLKHWSMVHLLHKWRQNRAAVNSSGGHRMIDSSANEEDSGSSNLRYHPYKIPPAISTTSNFDTCYGLKFQPSECYNLSLPYANNLLRQPARLSPYDSGIPPVHLSMRKYAEMLVETLGAQYTPADTRTFRTNDSSPPESLHKPLTGSQIGASQSGMSYDLKDRFEDSASHIASLILKCELLEQHHTTKTAPGGSLDDDIKAAEELLSSLQLEREVKSVGTSVQKRLEYQTENVYNSLFDEILFEVCKSAQADIKACRRELPPAALKQLNNAFNTSSPSKILVSRYNVELTVEKFRCLQPGTWLNDEVINFWIRLLDERDQNSPASKNSRVLFQNSFFYTKLSESGYNYRNVRRWTRKIKIFEYDKMILPINVGQVHWCLAVIFFGAKKIQYYDSMNGRGLDVLANLRRYLGDEAVDKGGPTFEPNGWTLVPSQKNTPQQKNGCDCGVFTCMFAHYISRDKQLDFGQKDMPYFRQLIGHSILNLRIEDDEYEC